MAPAPRTRSGPLSTCLAIVRMPRSWIVSGVAARGRRGAEPRVAAGHRLCAGRGLPAEGHPRPRVQRPRICALLRRRGATRRRRLCGAPQRRTHPWKLTPPIVQGVQSTTSVSSSCSRLGSGRGSAICGQFPLGRNPRMPGVASSRSQRLARACPKQAEPIAIQRYGEVRLTLGNEAALHRASTHRWRGSLVMARGRRVVAWRGAVESQRASPKSCRPVRRVGRGRPSSQCATRSTDARHLEHERRALPRLPQVGGTRLLSTCLSAEHEHACARRAQAASSPRIGGPSVVDECRKGPTTGWPDCCPNATRG